MDIEGAEFDALKGAIEILKTKRPIIFLATHGDEVKKNCLELLKEMSYKIEIIGNGTLEKADEFVCV